MRKYIIKRLIYLLIVFILLSFLLYLIYNAVPFDRALQLAEARRQSFKGDPDAPAKVQALYERYTKELGLDQNIFKRWLMWLGVVPLNGEYQGILQGNFGTSYTSVQKPAIDVIKEPMKNTIFINIFATILGLGITIPLGITCAVKKGKKLDTVVQVGSIIGYSMPVYITSILFIFLFAVVIPIFPVSGMSTPGNPYEGIMKILDKLYYMCLPLIVMTFCSLGGMIRYVRAAMTDALSMDCIRTARAKGLKEKVVIYNHAWRNALIPIVALVISWFLGIFSGSLMVESIFGLNGVGRLYIISLNGNDYNVVLALQMFYIIIGLLGNLLVDILYGIIDPRVRVDK